MKYKIESCSSFDRQLAKLLKKNPSLNKACLKVLRQLTTDPFDPSLKTHALSGELKGKYACSLSHDIRVIFNVKQRTIHLIAIGSHDEVY